MLENPTSTHETAHKDFKNLCEARIQFAVDESSNLLENTERPLLIVAYGPMAGGKSTFLKDITQQLQKKELASIIFKLSADSRGDEIQQAWTRNGPMKATPIETIQDAYEYLEELETGIAALDEVSFLGSSEELIAFVQYAHEQGISVIASGLGAWFNGEPLQQIHDLLDHADVAYCLQSYDSFNPQIPADFTLRGVGIAPDGKILHSNDCTNYYPDMTDQERLNIVQRLKQIDEQTILDICNPDGFPGIERCFLVPSHPADSKFAIGADRYVPVSQKKFNLIYQTAGLNPPNQPPISDLYNHPAIRNWEEVGLS
ncbi:hypothetical protein GF362_04845 [Candidatus Dojkabacteria bacterium]|nr:hypothetical protein [Candidatus Dojkabacteria bacterium]